MTRILFIDDDILTLDLMGKVAELLGYEALLSSNASSALEMAVNDKPDLILVDLSLPDGDGIGVIQTLRSLPTTAAIPVFLLSAGIASKTEEAAKLAGAEGCLEKPINLDVLNRVIKTFVKN